MPARKRDTQGSEVCGSLLNIHWLYTQILFQVVIRRQEGMQEGPNGGMEAGRNAERTEEMGEPEREGTHVNQMSVPGLCRVLRPFQSCGLALITLEKGNWKYAKVGAQLAPGVGMSEEADTLGAPRPSCSSSDVLGALRPSKAVPRIPGPALLSPDVYLEEGRGGERREQMQTVGTGGCVGDRPP